MVSDGEMAAELTGRSDLYVLSTLSCSLSKSFAFMSLLAVITMDESLDSCRSEMVPLCSWTVLRQVSLSLCFCVYESKEERACACVPGLITTV